MSYKIDINAVDVNWQIEMLKHFPEIANKHFYPAMHRGTSAIKGAVEPKIPVRTGLARSEFRKAVTGKGLNITGRVGWKSGIKAWYINIHEYGAPPHEIGYVPALNVTIKKHPGVPALKFMEKGQEEADDKVNPELARAADAVVNELDGSMANWMESWLDTLCEVMAITDPHGKQVTSYYVFKRNELPLAVSSEHIPCAISYVNDPEVQYSEGGPLEIFWKGQTEFHLTKDVSPANIPYILKFYEIILRACAAQMKLGGLVAYFSILQKTANSMQFAVYRNKDNEPDHEGILVRWEVYQNVSGDLTVSR